MEKYSTGVLGGVVRPAILRLRQGDDS
jgi:hypothetical protein